MADKPLLEMRLKLDPPPATWTKQDIGYVVFGMFVLFGDTLEINLPGVITQAISCELGVSGLQEGLLGVALYLPMALVSVAGGYLSNRFGKRTILLFSLVTSIIFNIFCSLVPNFYTLLLSRGLIGFTVGLNYSTAGVFLSENLSSRQHIPTGTFLKHLAGTMGRVWVALLGYLILERLGWRVFLLSSSLPVFIPPILILLCLVPTAPNEKSPEQDADKVPVEVPNVKVRIIKAYLLDFLGRFQGNGSILLVPALIRQINEQENVSGGQDCRLTSIHGIQFLILAVVGGANVLGRVLSHSLSRYSNFRILNSIVALLTALSYIVVIFEHDIMTMAVAMAAGMFFHSVSRNDVCVRVVYDPAYFGSSMLSVGSGIASAGGMTGSLVGVGLAAFLPPQIVVWVTVVLTACQVAVVLSVTEVDSPTYLRK